MSETIDNAVNNFSGGAPESRDFAPSILFAVLVSLALKSKSALRRLPSTDLANLQQETRILRQLQYLDVLLVAIHFPGFESLHGEKELRP
jgi:hypothetical protein